MSISGAAADAKATGSVASVLGAILSDRTQLIDYECGVPIANLSLYGLDIVCRHDNLVILNGKYNGFEGYIKLTGNVEIINGGGKARQEWTEGIYLKNAHTYELKVKLVSGEISNIPKAIALDCTKHVFVGSILEQDSTHFVRSFVAEESQYAICMSVPRNSNYSNAIFAVTLEDVTDGRFGVVTTDKTLSIDGKPADAKAVGDTVAELTNSVFTAVQRSTLLKCFRNIPWIDENTGKQCYDALKAALFPQDPDLPNGYVRIDALKSKDGQYINTGIPYNSTDVLELEAKGFHSDDLSSQWYIGVHEDADKIFGLKTNPNSNNVFYRFGSETNVAVKKALYPETKYKIKMSARSMYIDDVLVGSYNEYSFATTKPIYLFAYNGTALNTTFAREFYVYDFKITDSNNVETHHLVPCLDAAYKPCMYDIIAKTTYYNAGSGDFEY